MVDVISCLSLKKKKNRKFWFENETLKKEKRKMNSQNCKFNSKVFFLLWLRYAAAYKNFFFCIHFSFISLTLYSKKIFDF